MKLEFIVLVSSKYRNMREILAPLLLAATKPCTIATGMEDGKVARSGKTGGMDPGEPGTPGAPKVS